MAIVLRFAALGGVTGDDEAHVNPHTWRESGGRSNSSSNGGCALERHFSLRARRLAGGVDTEEGSKRSELAVTQEHTEKRSFFLKQLPIQPCAHVNVCVCVCSDLLAVRGGEGGGEDARRSFSVGGS